MSFLIRKLQITGRCRASSPESSRQSPRQFLIRCQPRPVRHLGLRDAEKKEKIALRTKWHLWAAAKDPVDQKCQIKYIWPCSIAIYVNLIGAHSGIPAVTENIIYNKSKIEYAPIVSIAVCITVNSTTTAVKSGSQIDSDRLSDGVNTGYPYVSWPSCI